LAFVFFLEGKPRIQSLRLWIWQTCPRSHPQEEADRPQTQLLAIFRLAPGTFISANGAASLQAWGNAPGKLAASERALKARLTGAFLKPHTQRSSYSTPCLRRPRFVLPDKVRLR